MSIMLTILLLASAPGLSSPLPTLSQLAMFLETYGALGLFLIGIAVTVFIIKFLINAWPVVKRGIRVVDTMLSAPEKLDALAKQASNLDSGFAATGDKLDALAQEVAIVKKQVLPNGGSSMRDDQHKLSRNLYKVGVALEKYTGEKLDLEDTRPRTANS